jgi:hypothetical protein
VSAAADIRKLQDLQINLVIAVFWAHLNGPYFGSRSVQIHGAPT